MQFTRLRLHGFKSFVESTELLIEAGLTGIVGPNGCGKSNLVEALQWVMGEASARRLRGGEMDDVIFAGTGSRPSRNIASVTLSLDNAGRPAALDRFDDGDGLEIDRRIERGKGSTYRVNGREVRARDVQLLFADAASGAQSPSLIGQGRIGWLIGAKPAERRVLIEEAAGITGLQARRHEAELRLAAAEVNLARLGDVQASLASQIERLKKQARQAERYRRLSEQLRLVEAQLVYRLWQERGAGLCQAADRQAAAASRSAAAAEVAADAERSCETARQALPPLRERAAAAARAVERLAGALSALQAERDRIARALDECGRRRGQLEQDRARERALAADAAAAEARLAAELGLLTAAQAGEAAARDEAAGEVAGAAAATEAAAAALAAAAGRQAIAEAARQAVAKQLGALDERRRRLHRQHAEAETRARELDLLEVSEARLAAIGAEAGAAERELAAAQAASELAEQAVRAAAAAHQSTRPRAQEAVRRAITLAAEIAALERLALASAVGGHAPLLDGLAVAPGLETALGAALGEDLLAPLDPAAPIHWAALGAEPAPPEPLPAGAEPLTAAVTGPALLQRRLARIGLVPDRETGCRLQAALRPGQRLVSRDGAAWRWDGLTVAAGTPTAAATRLEQRNRLGRLAAEHAAATADRAAAEAEERRSAAALDAAQQAERTARAAELAAAQRGARLRQTQLTLTQQHGQAKALRQAAVEARDRLAGELGEIAAQLAAAEAEQAALPDPALGRQEIERLRLDFARCRDAEALQQRELDRLDRDAAARRERTAAIAAESRSWQVRSAAAAAQAASLDERGTALEAESAALAQRPAALALEQAAAESCLATARHEAGSAAAALREAETAAGAAEQAQAAAARAHAETRETLIRTEALRDQAAEALAAASVRACEAFDCPAERLPERLGNAVAAGDEATAAIEVRLDRLRRDREAIGPVNLMAETELAELSAELEGMRRESEDLVAAIARLRHGIQQLDREGRERLVAAFEVVNRHFQELFTRLFGGGRAYLELVQPAGDPLAAGLEIMASPPGKKLQALSLLSGGERALTALALIFAVFLANPAPVCVLDEVDAPLDDANVERFCSLVREIGGRTGTRFLVITHHRVTMARMDRLYGVTMTERGVSRLVSVELQATERLRQTA